MIQFPRIQRYYKYIASNSPIWVKEEFGRNPPILPSINTPACRSSYFAQVHWNKYTRNLGFYHRYPSVRIEKPSSCLEKLGFCDDHLLCPKNQVQASVLAEASGGGTCPPSFEKKTSPLEIVMLQVCLIWAGSCITSANVLQEHGTIIWTCSFAIMCSTLWRGRSIIGLSW